MSDYIPSREIAETVAYMMTDPFTRVINLPSGTVEVEYIHDAGRGRVYKIEQRHKPFFFRKRVVREDQWTEMLGLGFTLVQKKTKATVEFEEIE